MSFRATATRWLAAAAAAILATLPTAAQACTVCMGKEVEGNMDAAMNGAIYFMLVCIGGMLAFITACGIVIVRRSHHPLPPHAQISPGPAYPDSEDTH
jgi:hypothetical protein